MPGGRQPGQWDRWWHILVFCMQWAAPGLGWLLEQVLIPRLISAELSYIYPGSSSCWPSRWRLKHNSKGCDHCHRCQRQRSHLQPKHGNSVASWFCEGLVTVQELSFASVHGWIPRLVNVNFKHTGVVWYGSSMLPKCWVTAISCHPSFIRVIEYQEDQVYSRRRF